MSAEPILELQDVHAGYGKIKALKGISLKVFNLSTGLGSPPWVA